MIVTATQILSELERRGVRLEVTGDKLRWRPKEALTPDLVKALKQWKAEIIATLTGSATTGFGQCPGPQKCGGCYSIPGGRFIHPPKVSEEWKAWLTKWQPKKGNPIQ